MLFTAFILFQALFGLKLYDSYKSLVMAGYQGWFNTGSDGANRFLLFLYFFLFSVMYILFSGWV
jgi:hypothetical protein